MDSRNLKRGQQARPANARRFDELQEAFLKTIERMKGALTLEERIDLIYHLQEITRDQKELLAALGGRSLGDGLKTSRKRK